MIEVGCANARMNLRTLASQLCNRYTLQGYKCTLSIESAESAEISEINLEYTRNLGSMDWWYWKNRFEGYPIGEECCDQYMIGLHGVKIKDPVKLRKKYLQYDALFESEKMKNITIPQRPHTFLYSNNNSTTKPLRNQDLKYRHK